MMTRRQRKSAPSTPRTTAVESTPVLTACWQDFVWFLKTLAVAAAWLTGTLLRLLGLGSVALVALGRWIAAKPLRGLDLLIAVAAAVALLSLSLPESGPQEALILPPLPAELDYSSSLDCLALNIYHEARGEPRDGQLAVAMVVMNRVNDPRFPNSVCDVVKQGGEARGCQFSWWCDGRSDRPTDRLAWAESRRVAEAVLAGNLEDPTGGALWYHADRVRPAWRMAIVKGPKIGSHVFYAARPEDSP